MDINLAKRNCDIVKKFEEERQTTTAFQPKLLYRGRRLYLMSGKSGLINRISRIFYRVLQLFRILSDNQRDIQSIGNRSLSTLIRSYEGEKFKHDQNEVKEDFEKLKPEAPNATLPEQLAFDLPRSSKIVVNGKTAYDKVARDPQDEVAPQKLFEEIKDNFFNGNSTLALNALKFIAQQFNHSLEKHYPMLMSDYHIHHKKDVEREHSIDFNNNDGNVELCSTFIRGIYWSDAEEPQRYLRIDQVRKILFQDLIRGELDSYEGHDQFSRFYDTLKQARSAQ